MTREI